MRFDPIIQIQGSCILIAVLGGLSTQETTTRRIHAYPACKILKWVTARDKKRIK